MKDVASRRSSRHGVELAGISASGRLANGTAASSENLRNTQIPIRNPTQLGVVEGFIGLGVAIMSLTVTLRVISHFTQIGFDFTSNSAENVLTPPARSCGTRTIASVFGTTS